MDKYKLLYEIKKKGITVDKFCMETGISRSAFYKKCNGKSDFTLGEMKKIMEYLDISDPMPIFFCSQVS